MRFIILSALFSFLISCSSDEGLSGPITHAAADIYLVNSPDGKNFTKGDLIGNAALQYQDGVTTMTISISDLEPNTSHAIHIHQGTLETPGKHWNQGKFVSFCNERSLGKVWAKPAAGDVGNIDIDESGNGTFSIQTDFWALGTEDFKDISNTVIFIHHMEEDFLNECDPNHEHQHGHTNMKIAGGTIHLGAQVLN